MCAEDIFRVTLQQMANDGNEQAKLALTLADQLPGRPKTHAVAFLKESQADLNEALRHNDYSWTGSTDQAIKRAQGRITEALMIIGK